MRSKLVRNFVIIIALALLVSGIVVFIVIKTLNSNEVFLTIVPKSYCYVSLNNEEKEIELMVYVSDKKSFVTKEEKVIHSYIESYDRIDKLLINLVGIKDLNTKVYINNRNYYLYSYKYEVPVKAEEEYELSIPNAIVIMDFPEDEVKLNIGSFYFQKVPYYGDKESNLSVSRVKGIVNYVDNNKTLVGVLLGFRNLSTRNIYIKNIEIIDKTVYPAMNEAIVKKEEFGYSDSISKILGYDYDYYKGEENNNCNFLVKGEEILEIVVPLKYKSNYIIDNISFKISYEIDGELFTFYSDKINMFNDMNVYIDESKLEVISYDFAN